MSTAKENFKAKNITKLTNIMKLKGLMMAALAATFVFVGCNKNEEPAPTPELKLAEATAEVAADATTYELTVEANCDWTATATEGVALDPSAGKGNAEVTLTFAANEAYEPVTYTVTFKAEGVEDQTFTLTQAAAEKPAPVLTLAKTEDSVEAAATSYELAVTSNVAWTATASEGVTLEPAAGEGDGKVVLTFAENKAYEPVVYTVTFKAEGVEDQVFTLNQVAAEKPAPVLTLAKASDEVAVDATSYELTLTANCPWTATASEGATLAPDSGEGDGKVTISFAANSAYEPKTYTVIFKVEGLDDQTFTLTQAAAPRPFVTLAKATDGVKATETSYEISLSANCAWTATASEGATVAPDAGEGDGKVTLSFAENETYEQVTYTVTFKATDVEDQVFTLTQAASEKPRAVTIAEFNALPDGNTVYEISGTITGIYQAYNSSFGNISVYLKDATAQTLVFRMSCEGIAEPAKIAEGDKVTVQGTKTTYSNAAQMAQGGKVISYEKFVAQPTEWGVVGDLNKWGEAKDVVMYTTWHTEKLYVAYNVNIASGAFKIRANNAWVDAKNYGLSVAGNVYANSYYSLINGSGSQNITPMAYGKYDVYFDLAKKRIALMTPGKPYSEAENGGNPVVVVTGLKDHTWGVIGDFPGNSWTSDYAKMEVDGDWAVAKNVPLKKNQEFKVRADKAWTLSYGTACDVNVGKTYTSHNNGGNMKFIGEDGNYNLYFSLVDAKFYMEKAAASSEPVTIVLSAATRPCADFPNTSAGVKTKTTYTIGGYQWTFSPSSGNKFSWYDDQDYILWGKQGGYILMPAVEGKKLTKVTILTGKGASTKVNMGVYNEAGTSAVSGGTAKTLSAQNSEFSWTLTGTANNTKYQLRVTSEHNAQLQKLTLVYE